MSEHHTSLQHQLFKDFFLPFGALNSQTNKQKNKKRKRKTGQNRGRTCANRSEGMKRYSLRHDYDLNEADEEED